MGSREVADEPISVVDSYVLDAHSFGIPRDEGIDGIVDFEKDVQDRNNQCEGEHVEYRRENIQDDSSAEVFFIGGGVLPHHSKEFFHRKTLL